MDTTPQIQALSKSFNDHESPHGTVTAVSMMKDEAPFLLEWVAHHIAVGFNRILIFTNDCTDGTDTMIMRLEELGLSIHRENVLPEGMKPQPAAIRLAQADPSVIASDWVILIDADEFLSVNHPSGHLDGLLNDAVKVGANGVVFTWRIFGSGGVVDWSRERVTKQYTRAAPMYWNKGWGVKTLFKFDPKYWRLAIHRPRLKKKFFDSDFPDSVFWLNGSGRPMADSFKYRGWRSIRSTVGYEWGQVNHYALKSVDSYMIRRQRGNVNLKKDKYNHEYWSLQDRNEVEDLAIQRFSTRTQRIMDALLTDPVLKRLHEEANQRIEDKLAIIKASPTYEETKAELLEAGRVPIYSVIAKPPVARDPAKIAAIMSLAGKDETKKKKEKKPKTDNGDIKAPGWIGAYSPIFLEDINDVDAVMAAELIPNNEIKLPASPELFTPDALRAVVKGKLDRRNLRNLSGYFDGTQRVMVLGSAIGLVAMKLMSMYPGIVVMSHDERSKLVKLGNAIALENGLQDSGRLKFTDGPLVLPGDDEDTEAGGLAAMIKDFVPDCVRIGDASLVQASVFASLDIACVKRIVIPFDTQDQEAPLRDGYGATLKDAGFVLNEDMISSGSMKFDRA